MTRALRVMTGAVGCSVAQALTMATSGPAAVLGRGDLGMLGEGLPADFVHLDAGLHLGGVWRAAQPV